MPEPLRGTADVEQTIELEQLRRGVTLLNRENAMLRDMLKIAIEVADRAILSTVEHDEVRRAGDNSVDHDSKPSRRRHLQWHLPCERASNKRTSQAHGAF